MARYFSTQQIFDWQKKRCVAAKTAKNFIECRVVKIVILRRYRKWMPVAMKPSDFR